MVNTFYRGNGQEAHIDGLFTGQAAVLVCNGPSVKTLDRDLIHKPGFSVMCVNNGGHGIRPNLWCGQDEPSKFMHTIFEDPKIMKFTRRTHGTKKYWRQTDFSKHPISAMPNMYFHPINSEPAIDDWLDRPSISWGAKDGDGHRCSIFLCALSILYKLGFMRVFLVGADFRMNQENPYFFDEVKTEGEVAYNNRLFELIDNQCHRLRPIFDSHQFMITNCTHDSGLTAFETGDLAACLAERILDTDITTKGMYTSRAAKEAVVNRKYKTLSKAIIYYSDNRIDGAVLNDACRKTLIDSGLPIISVTHRPIDFGKNITVNKRPSGRSLIEQVIIGLENTDADFVYLTEHDCLYHPSHFEIVSGVVAYNTNYWRLTPLGYHLHPRTKPVLSACMGPRRLLLDAMRKKLETYIAVEADYVRRGINIEKERVRFMYEPGRGHGPSGSQWKCWLAESELPCVDVRHENNFTGKGFLLKWKYQNELPFWGTANERRKLLKLR